MEEEETEQETPPEKPVMLKGRILELRTRSEWAQNWGLGTLRYMGEDKKFRNIPIVGPLRAYRLGDNVEVVGVLHKHEKYGRQLKVFEISHSADDPKQMLKTWLSENLDHLGDVRSGALLEVYGTGLIDILNLPNAAETVEKLCVINGITELRAAELIESWNLKKSRFEMFRRLSDIGLSASEIKEALEAGLSPDAVLKDPFLLYYSQVLSAERFDALMDRGFPELKDTAKHYMVIAHAATKRICEDGDTAAKIQDVIHKISEEFDFTTTAPALKELIKEVPGRLEVQGECIVPFEYSRAEKTIASFVRKAMQDAAR